MYSRISWLKPEFSYTVERGPRIDDISPPSELPPRFKNAVDDLRDELDKDLWSVDLRKLVELIKEVTAEAQRVS